jgi:beta-glucanase (GH16 family)
MVMDSEFDSSSLDTNLWQPGWFGTGITDPVNGGEDNCYNSANVVPTSTALDLNVTAQSSTCNGKTYPYTGSLISSRPDGSNAGFLYTYGVLEARVYIPAATNGAIANWPAVWATTTPSETYGEDDLVEGLAGQACYHYHDSAEAPGGCDTTLTPGWHTFASNWQPGSITYYYDGTEVGTITSVITTQPMYIILNNTVSASNLSLASANTMKVQYVRVWQS